jgi:hypothetical protein
MTLQTGADFDGVTYDRKLDKKRLSTQLLRIYNQLLDGRWHSLQGLAFRCNAPESSVSARLRDLRKPKFGALRIERRRVENGLHEYRLGSEPCVE